MASVSSRVDVAVFQELAAIDRLAAIHVERLLPGALSAAQFGVLGRVAEAPGQSPSQLAQALALSKPTMTHALTRLDAAGFVVIEADGEDRRRKRIGLTKAGEAAYLQGAVALSPMMQALRASFATDEFEAALPFLSRLRAWLQSGGLRERNENGAVTGARRHLRCQPGSRATSWRRRPAWRRSRPGGRRPACLRGRSCLRGRRIRRRCRPAG